MNLTILTWYETKTWNSDFPWQMMMSSDVSSLVMCPVCISGVYYLILVMSLKTKNNVIDQLQLSRGFIGEHSNFNITSTALVKEGDQTHPYFWLVNLGFAKLRTLCSNTSYPSLVRALPIINTRLRAFTLINCRLTRLCVVLCCVATIER